MNIIKPKLDVAGQIEHLCSKGVKFDIISKEDALSYLSENNNYFKLRSYRKNYPKHPDGKNAGKYINLDFAFLKDLSIIDMRLRYLLLHMALDVEHFAKVKLISEVCSSDEDGYEIVSDFQSSLAEEQKEALSKEIDRSSSSPYCVDIINKYKEDGFPIWAFVEIISLSRFISFYDFCAERLDNDDIKDDFYLMQSIKGLRNATAHNNCILNDLKPRTSRFRTNYDVMEKLGKISISKSTRNRKMSNIRIQQIVTLLYTHKKLVTSTGIKKHQANELHSLFERIYRNMDYYKSNNTISSVFSFLKKIVDKWFPMM